MQLWINGPHNSNDALTNVEIGGEGGRGKKEGQGGKGEWRETGIAPVVEKQPINLKFSMIVKR